MSYSCKPHVTVQVVQLALSYFLQVQYCIIAIVALQPVENYSQWRLLYFISFLLLVGFFVLNMFVGVVVENFHRCREEQEKEEKARRAAKRAKKLEKKRRSKCHVIGRTVYLIV